jgi:hypothetical protein
MLQTNEKSVESRQQWSKGGGESDQNGYIYSNSSQKWSSVIQKWSN